MTIGTRAVLWLFGIMLLFMPLFLAVVPDLAEIDVVMSVEAYRIEYKELLFVGVAAAALALTEAAELLFARLAHNDWWKIVAIALLGTIAMLGIASAVFYGRASDEVEDRRQAIGRCLAECNNAQQAPACAGDPRLTQPPFRREAVKVAWTVNGVIIFLALVLRLILWSTERSQGHGVSADVAGVG